MATEEDRSIRNGMSFPIWMRSGSRNKLLQERLDFNESTFSPPENDDSFLYFRYPRIVQSREQANQETITIVKADVPTTTPQVAATLDIGKHTAPCRDFITGKKEVAQSQILNSNGKIKSAGTDDGFKGEVAECGSSVIRVASQIISSKVIKGFEPYEQEEQDYLTTGGFDPQLRRGSYSVPASPNASPKSKRKGNKYFTSAYVDDNKPGSILANLLASKKDDISKSITSINEEQSKLKFSIGGETIEKKSVTPKPKPSQLREMNFWSPTSM